MTYNDFTMVTYLNKLKSYQKLDLDESGYEYMCAFNGTSTKSVILKQPKLISDYLQNDKNHDTRTVEFELDNKFNITSS